VYGNDLINIDGKNGVLPSSTSTDPEVKVGLGNSRLGRVVDPSAKCITWLERLVKGKDNLDIPCYISPEVIWRRGITVYT
jgi:hypothetical protein